MLAVPIGPSRVHSPRLRGAGATQISVPLRERGSRAPEECPSTHFLVPVAAKEGNEVDRKLKCCRHAATKRGARSASCCNEGDGVLATASPRRDRCGRRRGVAGSWRRSRRCGRARRSRGRATRSHRRSCRGPCTARRCRRRRRGGPTRGRSGTGIRAQAKSQSRPPPRRPLDSRTESRAGGDRNSQVPEAPPGRALPTGPTFACPKIVMRRALPSRKRR